VGSKWANEVVFLAIGVLLPVYGLAGLADVLIFNSIEFWTGDNPIDPPSATMAQADTKTITRGNQRVILERTDTGEARQMRMAIYEGDQLVREFSMEARLDEPTVVKDAEGNVIGSAQTLADGTIVLLDAQGREQSRYSSRQIDRIAKKVGAASARD